MFYAWLKQRYSDIFLVQCVQVDAFSLFCHVHSLVNSHWPGYLTVGKIVVVLQHKQTLAGFSS